MAKPLAAFLAICFLSCELQAASISRDLAQQKEGLYVTVVKNFQEYTEKNPNLQLQALAKNSLGAREQGDSLAITFGEVFLYPILSDASAHENFPDSVNTRIINFVDIHFEANAEGKAYLEAGGVRQNFLSLVIEAPALKTGKFNYEVYVYGKKLRN